MTTNKEAKMFIAGISVIDATHQSWEDNVGIIPVETLEEGFEYVGEHREALLAACPRYVRSLEDDFIDAQYPATIWVKELKMFDF